MKIIYYKKNININSHNISSYHLLLKCLENINESPDNIDNFYLSSLEGHPLKNSSIISNSGTYLLKRRLKGSSEIKRAGNSGPLFLTSGIFFGILTVIFYNIYLKIILGKINDKVQIKVQQFAIENMSKYAAYPQSGGDAETEAKKILNKASSPVKEFFRKICVWIENNLADNNIGQYLCYSRGVIPYFTMREDEGSIAATISSTFFYLYMFIILITMFSNGVTMSMCGVPNKGLVVFQIVLLFVPLVLAFFSGQITDKLDEFMKKLGRVQVFSKFRLLFTNVLLLILLIIYMSVNKGGISGALGGMLIPAIILFALFDGISGVSINQLLSKISSKISNFVYASTVFSQVPEDFNKKTKKASPTNEKYEPIPKSNENKKQLPLKNIAECYPRFGFFFNLLKIIIMSLIGWMFMSVTFAAQIQTACGN